MNNLCIIPARGGSKRIPKKNIKDFYGKPMIAYAIQLAQESKLFSEIMVSTDSKEIADVAINYGATIPFYRSEENADDFSTTKDVMIEVIEQYQDKEVFFDNICCIYPTAVLASLEDLNLGYKKLGSNKFVLPVTRFSFPPQRSFHQVENQLQYKYPENINKRSQDLEPLFHDAGQWYWLKVEALEEFNTDCEMAFIEVPGTRVQDIDNLEDLKIAELKFKKAFK